jgi:peptidoglycan/LPS O-acetylase OafA/YrhL
MLLEQRSTTAPPFGHCPALDGVRGLAILSVLFFHTDADLLKGGFLGVDLFFVLSGFLITTLLVHEFQRNGSISYRRFYVRRATRLLPALFVMLAACWATAILCNATEAQRTLAADTLPSLFYFLNWLSVINPDRAVSPLLHTWSLCIEEQFYLVWPLILGTMLRCRVRRRWLAAVVLVGVVGPAAWRIAISASAFRGDVFKRIYFGSDTRADALMVGCFTALLIAWKARPQSIKALTCWRWVGAAAFVFLLVAARTVTMGSNSVNRFGEALVDWSSATLIISLIWSAPTLLVRLMEGRLLRWLGRISYGIYLWNIPIYYLMHRVAIGRPPAWLDAFDIAAALAAGAASYYLIERPVRRFARGSVDRGNPSIRTRPNYRRQPAFSSF